VAVLECGSLLPLFCWTACCPIGRTQASLVLIKAQASLRTPHLLGGQFDTSVVREDKNTTNCPYLWGNKSPYRFASSSHNNIYQQRKWLVTCPYAFHPLDSPLSCVVILKTPFDHRVKRCRQIIKRLLQMGNLGQSCGRYGPISKRQGLTCIRSRPTLHSGLLN